MDQPPRRHEAITWQRRQFLIENYALLTENVADLREKRDWWMNFYRPASPGESEQLEIVVMASVQRDRIQQHLTEVVNQQIRSAIFDLDTAAEDRVEAYRAMLPTNPGAALVGLKRSALGLRFLIQRWQRLLDLLREEKSLSGHDLEEILNYQGAKGSRPEDLYASDGAFLTAVYSLLNRADQKEKDFSDMGREGVMPEATRHRKPEHWFPGRDQALKLLIELAERELAILGPREEYLRITFDEPARDGAEIKRQVLASPEGARLARQLRMHQQEFARAYDAFLKGRKHSEKTGRVPGVPVAGIHFQADEGRESPITRSVMPTVGVPVEVARAQRKRGADTLAPGGLNGIGAPVASGDAFRVACMAMGVTREQRIEAEAREAEERTARASSQ